MQRSSPSIAALAAALAKAQSELVNPEKSLVGSIRGDGPRASERLFRYAPLSSGLEIVRKTLGQHEIATVQTTAVDQAAGMVNLTTLLAHSSGEWIASDWPVCPISETATPHRMGAALTYARRYALFTLVGIAGEDDLDAPDLIAPAQSTPVSSTPSDDRARRGKNGHGGLHSGDPKLSARTPLERPKVTMGVQAAVALSAEMSARLRDQMLAELEAIGDVEEMAPWARRRFPEKKKLSADDAKLIESKFRVKLLSFAIHKANSRVDDQAGAEPGAPANSERDAPIEATSASSSQGAGSSIDKTVLPFPEPRRIRDREHVRHVAKQPCLVCGRAPADAHHLRFAQARALGRKVSDEFTVPLCRGHHRELHRCGDEAAWWSQLKIDPTAIARALWVETHPSTQISFHSTSNQSPPV